MEAAAGFRAFQLRVPPTIMGVDEDDMERSIDELLSGEEPQVEQAEATSEPEAQAEGQPRGPDGKFAPKQTGVEEEPEATPEPEVEPPSTDQLPREVYEPLKAVRNENKELKERLEAMQRQHEAFMQQMQRQQQPEEQPIDFWDNPTGVVSAEAKKAAQMAIREFQQQQQMERIDASEQAARTRYADYGDAFRHFQQAASVNPALIQQMTSAPDPGEFAYKTGRRAMDLEKVGSLDELLKAERAKWEAEARAGMPAPQQSFPQSTAADGSVGPRSGPAWSGPRPIGELLG